MLNSIDASADLFYNERYEIVSFIALWQQRDEEREKRKGALLLYAGGCLRIAHWGWLDVFLK